MSVEASSSAQHSAPSNQCSIRAVLIDFGHTLVHYEVPDALLIESYREAHARLAAANGAGTVTDDLLLRVGRHLLAAIHASYSRGELEELDHHVLFAEALAAHGYRLGAELVQELVTLEHQAFARRLLVPAPTLAALAELRARGLRLGLVSNVSVPAALMRRTLATIGLADHFAVTAFSSEVGVRKPHPRIYQMVLDGLAVTPSEAVFVGDRLKEDIVGPRTLGMRAILTHEYRQEPPELVPPDGLVTRFAELPALLTRLGAESASRCS